MTIFSGVRATNILTGPGCSPNQTSPEGGDGCYAGGYNAGTGGQKGLPFREHVIFGESLVVMLLCSPQQQT